MSAYELNQMLAGFSGILASLGGYLISGLLSLVIVNFGIRWFIFKKAGEKGWKALIPFYSDYINYKIAWDTRIFLALLGASVGGFLLGFICGLINGTLGAIVSTLCNTVTISANALAGIILQFKMARAFGRNDYFAAGLCFLGPVFTAILAFGDAEYKGPARDGIGVPKFVDDLGQKAAAAAASMAQMHQQPQHQPSYQQPPYQQPGGYPSQQTQGYPPNYQAQGGYPPQYAPQGGYAPQQQPPAPRAGRRSQRHSGQYDPMDP